MIVVGCECGAQLGVPEEYVGTRARCCECRREVRLVAAELFGDEAWCESFGCKLLIEKRPGRPAQQIFIGGAGPIRIGTARGSHVMLPGTLVSPSHAHLRRGEPGWWVFDHDSTQGLFVNSVRVRERALHDGDLLRIGEYDLLFVQQRRRTAERRTMPTPPVTVLPWTKPTALDELAVAAEKVGRKR